MRITVCRCQVCGSANIASLAWVCPNDYAGGLKRLIGADDISWADRDGSVWCDDCFEESDYWDEEELDGTVVDGKALVYDQDMNLVTIQQWCEAHPYDTDDDYDEEDEEV